MLTCHLGGKYHAISGRKNNKNIDFMVDLEEVSYIINYGL